MPSSRSIENAPARIALTLWPIAEKIPNGWWLGAAFGLAHGLFAGTALVRAAPGHPSADGHTFSAAADRPLSEPPGFMMLNYGRRTPLATILAHVAYGTIVGGFISLAS